MVSYKVSASILDIDFLHAAEEVDSIIEHVDELHLDICDGDFVPSLSFGTKISALIGARYARRCHIDTHLMISAPQKYFQGFVDAGARSIIFHIEAVRYPHTLITALQSHNVSAGVGIIPKTPASVLAPLYEFCNRVLVMTVNPGFGGQSLIPQMLRKVEHIRQQGGDDMDIIVDGGININTIQDAKNAGANVFVIGSGLFNAPQRVEYIQQIRSVL